MDPISASFNSDFKKDQMINASFSREDIPFNKNGRTQVFDNLVNEGCEHFFPYLDFIGLAKASDILFLSSNRHFYYDAEELKDISTIVNLKPLNHIKDIRNLLHDIFRILPQKSCVVGCFVNSKKQNLFSDQPVLFQPETYENSIESRIPILNKMYNLIDMRTNRYLSPRTAGILLEDSGLKVINMTEINGLTYFYARKAHHSAE